MLNDQRGAVRSVMDMSLFLMLLLSGLLCSAFGSPRNYYFINQNMSWTEAQSYFRERFTDLATVDSMDDVNRMINTVNDGYSGSVWIGLKKGTQRQWSWSMGNEAQTQYSGWWGSEPNGDGECVFISFNYWYDFSCAAKLYFMCYDEMTGYKLVQSLKNWTEAQSYCREYFTDLATSHNAVEQSKISLVIGDTSWIWIGLFLDSWQWSDQWSLLFRNWAAGQSSGDCVAMSTTDSGKWVRYGCEQLHPFICYEDLKKQIVRLNLSHDGKYNRNDPSLQTDILNQINNKLMSMGLKGYKNINWRMDEGGEVFHLKSKHTVNSTLTCDYN